MRSFAVFMACILISYIGLVGLFVIGSSFVEEALAGRMGIPVDTSVYGKNEAMIIESGMFAINDPNAAGMFNRVYIKKNDGLFYSDFTASLIQASILSLVFDGLSEGELQIAFPFLVLLAGHLFLVLLVRALAFMPVFQMKAARSFAGHLILSLMYAIGFLWWSQFARMVWASDRWGSGAYLNDSRAGLYGLVLIYSVSVLSYFYILYAMSNFCVRSDSNQTCIRCKYDMGDSACCAECGLEAGAFIDSKFRVNHLYLAGMMLVTFFSPVLVASVYSVLG